jgi:hypothetical protein
MMHQPLAAGFGAGNFPVVEGQEVAVDGGLGIFADAADDVFSASGVDGCEEGKAPGIVIALGAAPILESAEVAVAKNLQRRGLRPYGGAGFPHPFLFGVHDSLKITQDDGFPSVGGVERNIHRIFPGYRHATAAGYQHQDGESHPGKDKGTKAGTRHGISRRLQGVSLEGSLFEKESEVRKNGPGKGIVEGQNGMEPSKLRIFFYGTHTFTGCRIGAPGPGD